MSIISKFKHKYDVFLNTLDVPRKLKINQKVLEEIERRKNRKAAEEALASYYEKNPKPSQKYTGSDPFKGHPNVKQQ